VSFKELLVTSNPNSFKNAPWQRKESSILMNFGNKEKDSSVSLTNTKI